MYKLAALAAVCFFMFISWIIYLADSGSNSIFFDFIRIIPYGDKFGHAGLFGLLTILLIIAFKFRSFGIGKVEIYYGFSLVFIFVVVEELSQIFFPSRTFDFADLVADIAGILVAVAMCFIGSKYLTKSSSKDAARGAA